MLFFYLRGDNIANILRHTMKSHRLAGPHHQDGASPPTRLANNPADLSVENAIKKLAALKSRNHYDRILANKFTRCGENPAITSGRGTQNNVRENER